jgi:hypothetical protein
MVTTVMPIRLHSMTWALAAAVALACGASAGTSRLTFGGTSILYHGESIRLSHRYFDYEQYKSDPDNIHPDEIARVQRLVKAAPLESSYPDRKSLFHALAEVPFPGYGSGVCAESKQADGTVLLVYSVEIPRAGAERYLIVREHAGEYSLVDDFVASERDLIRDVRDVPEGLAFTSVRGNVTLHALLRK